jgi:UDP-N-acetylmuramoylalanine--D-glutamate ligase
VIVSITGTNGKSTVTALVTHILKNLGIKCVMGGNIGVPFCDLTEPADVYVLEMSSYEIAISKFFRSHIGCVLNISQDHLVNHGSFENYISSKHKLLRNSKVKIISHEDQITFGVFGTELDVVKISGVLRDSDVYYDSDMFENSRKIMNLSSLENLPGMHNRENICFAYAICRSLGVADHDIATHVSSFVPLPHRLNVVRKISNVLFVNDSKATNPQSAKCALEAFGKYRIYWMIGGRSKKSDASCVMQYMPSIEKIYLFGEAQDEFFDIFRDKKECMKCDSIKNALVSAFRNSSESVDSGVVLFSPMTSSFDEFRNFEERGEFFCKLVSEL